MAMMRVCSRLARSAMQRQQQGLALSSSPPFMHFSSLHSNINSKEKEEERRKVGCLGGPCLATPGAVSFSSSSLSAKERPPADLVLKNVVLYQYEVCPFCNKVRAFLDYHDIPYRVVEVNPINKKELKWSEYKKVPVLMVDGQQFNDSSVIISVLNEKVNPKKTGVEADEAAKEEEEKWWRWVDENLVHVLPPNIYRTPSEALESFDYITNHGNFSGMERMMGKYVGAAAMYFVAKRLRKRHNIENERAALFKAAEDWVNALHDRAFMGGSKPNSADLAVFGVLKSIRNLQAGEDMIKSTKIGAWYSRMESRVGGSSRIMEPQQS